MKSLTIAALLATALAVSSNAQVKNIAAAPDYDLHQNTEAARLDRANDDSEKSLRKVASATQQIAPVPPKSTKTPGALAAHAPSPNNASVTSSSSQIYRVGVRDVLDIQLTDNPSSHSTLFTVLEGGLLDYPFAGSPLAVAGLTTAEIAALLRQRIKIFDKPTVAVNVRDFASHAVSVSGFVAAPGTKTLRREAVPLYTILAEALVLPEASQAMVMRAGRAPLTVDLRNGSASAVLIVAGDTIKVSGLAPAPTEFFFIGGVINAPGQKPYSRGLTLTQAILASGGTRTPAVNVRVSRQGADGKLTTAQYSLRQIQSGKLPDPLLQNGDRLEVVKAN